LNLTYEEFLNELGEETWVLDDYVYDAIEDYNDLHNKAEVIRVLKDPDLFNWIKNNQGDTPVEGFAWRMFFTEKNMVKSLPLTQELVTDVVEVFLQNYTFD